MISRASSLWVWAALVVVSGCAQCEPAPAREGEGEGEGDTGAGEGEGDAAEGEGDTGEGEGEPQCGMSTPGFGTPCSRDPMSSVQCGIFVCNPMTDELVCADPGANPCGVCQPRDTLFNDDAGGIGDACGEFGCGVAICQPDNLGTLCVGDRPRNACDGCEDLFPAEAAPGDSCSACETGTYLCATSKEELLCWLGNSPDNRCGSCERCTQFHAFMDDRFEGGFIRNGTVAVIDDVGGGGAFAPLRLVFDPLVSGPGLNGLPAGRLLLASGPDPDTFVSFPLTPSVAQAPFILSDPHRSYDIEANIDLSIYNTLILIDESQFFDRQVYSVGVLVPGPPPAP
jgi:hypothetical protein